MTFGQFVTALRARYWVIALCLAVTVGVVTVISLIMPKTYTSTATVLVDTKAADPLTGMTTPALIMPGYMSTQLDVLTSRTVAVKVVDKLHLADSPEVRIQFQDDTRGRGEIRYWLADLLLKKLDARPSRDSNVMEVSFSNENPQFATLLANAFAEAFIETSLDLKVAPARQTAAWFDQQLKGLRNNLEKAQRQLSAYQQEKGIVAIDERLDVENAKLIELSSLVTSAQGQRVEGQSRQRQLGEVSGAGREGLPEIMSSPMVQNLKAELARAETKLAEANERLGRNHPQFKQAQSEVDSIRRKLDQEIRTASSGIVNTAQMQQKRETELRAALATQKSRVLELKKLRDEMGVLTREVENAQRAYDAALQRASQTRMESEANQSNVVLLARAVEPINPSKPRVLLNIALSVFLGGVLGLLCAFLMELFDRRVRSVDELAEALDVRTLAALPKYDQKNPTRRWRWRRRKSASHPIVTTTVQY
ncbi:chain length determinant protein EpsF [Chitinivorax tropicus]|uniref:Chain length determinant protein EpsF n=1 Tax=Chitinivorax tropicus TaxID=714531 RepID=A0A840MTH4_9PROT|nr:chain length determinant protein EpsF [Chitinivorax tropicus]MBB5019583.1 chain length determinant protein EpsF [Chitinivorax tropicus]